MQKLEYKLLKIVVGIGLATIVIGLVMVALEYGVNKTEQNECHKWNQEAQEYPGYYLADWQKEQCLHHEIEVLIQEIEEYNEVTATIYAYNSEVSQTDSDPLIMASGNMVYDGAIACPDFIKMRTSIEIDGKIYICEDRMAWRYRNDYNFDIWFASKEAAIEWGVQEKLIKIYE